MIGPEDFRALGGDKQTGVVMALHGYGFMLHVCAGVSVMGAGSTAHTDQRSVNPLRAKFFRVNINIYLYFVSFLHTNKTQVVEIPPRVRQGPAYST